MEETWVQSIPGLGISPGEGNGNTLQFSCLEKSHGQRIHEGYRTEELEMTDHLSVSKGY